MADILGLVAVILGLVLCMLCANLLAKRKGWSPSGWMISTLVLGPLPLILMLLLPGRRRANTPEDEGSASG